MEAGFDITVFGAEANLNSAGKWSIDLDKVPIV